MSVLVVSWVLVLLAVFGLNYTHDVIVESRSVALEFERHQLRAWAWSGIELAQAVLAEAPVQERSVLVNGGLERRFGSTFVCGQGRFTIGVVADSGGRASWRPGLKDEGSLLPVAVADSTTLSMLPGMTPQGIAAILRARRTAAGDRLPPFALLELDAASLASAECHLSRHGTAVNINTAPANVLRALGLPRTAVDKLLSWRAGQDRILGTSDDQHLANLDCQGQWLRTISLNSEEAAVLAFLAGAGRLTVESRFFSLASRGWGEGFQGICEIQAVLEKPEQGSVRIIEWNENWLQ